MKKTHFRLYYRILVGLIVGGMLCSSPAVANRFDKVNVRTWDTNTKPNFFPETDDPRVAVDWLKERPSFGIAFSGGGTRSAAATLGELRALKELGWIDKARYISANSGGSWTVMPFIYLPNELDKKHFLETYGLLPPEEIERRFLGTYVPPEQIDDTMLGPDREMDKLSMSRAIAKSRIWTKLPSARRRDEAYADVIGKIFLKPFDLHKREKVFTFHDKALQVALEANSDLEREDFQFVTRQRPYPIFVGSLSVPPKWHVGNGELFLVEATPLYTGIRNEFLEPLEISFRNLFGNKNLLIGGGYIESFGYDSYAPKGDGPNADGLWEVRLEGKLSDIKLRKNKRYRFTLSDVIGMSGAAPAITIEKARIAQVVFPAFRHWAVDRKTVLGDKNLQNKAKEMVHGDGGDIDNLAVMPLLSRKVENILAFINTSTSFPKRNADCGNITNKVMTDDLISLFTAEGTTKNNLVIKDQDGEKLKALCQAFSELKKKGEPLVYCDQYGITDNKRLAVLGKGYRPSICWVYLDRSNEWIAKIKAGSGNGKNTTSALKAQRGNFDTFPHYLTFFETTKVIDLNPGRVHALSNLTAWSVIKSKKYLEENLLEPYLDQPSTEKPSLPVMESEREGW